MYVLDSKSTASGRATAANPRIIFSDVRTGFTLAMNTSPSDPEAGFLEVAAPTGDHRVAQVKVIELPEGGAGPVRFIEDPYRHFAGHPQKDCRTCHGTRFRYRWEGRYPFWPGVLSDHHTPDLSPEHANILEQLRKHPLVRRTLPDGDGLAQQLSFRSTDFNQMIARLHGERMVHDLISAPQFSQYRKLLDHVLDPRSHSRVIYPLGTFNLDQRIAQMTSPEILALVPENRRADFKLRIPELIRSSLEVDQAYRRRMLSKVSSEVHLLPTLSTGLVQYTYLKYVCDELKISLRDWLPANDPQLLYFSDGYQGLYGEYSRGFFNQLKRRVRELYFRCQEEFAKLWRPRNEEG